MDTIRQISQHRPAAPREVTSGDAECKILPFRQARSSKPTDDNEAIRERFSDEFEEEYPFPESGRFQVACLAQYPDADPCRDASPRRWLKKVLFAGAFTAWAVAAIAMSMALG